MRKYIELRLDHPKFDKYLNKAYRLLKKTKAEVLSVEGGPESIRINYQDKPKKEVKR